MTHLGQSYPPLVALNAGALRDPRLRIVTMDAHTFLEQDSRLYDVIIADLPDPNSEVLAKLYSLEHYRLIRRHLAASGVFVTQATSPFFARDAFWCIVQTMQAAGLHTVPMHTYVPSFGDWGFVMAAARRLRPEQAQIQVPTQFLTAALLPQMLVFGKDVSAVPVDVSTLDQPLVLRYYLSGWKQWE
jgi:spermidine synthase